MRFFHGEGNTKEFNKKYYLQSKNHEWYFEARLKWVPIYQALMQPGGITIAGLNQMEHEGLSSALIKGIITSAKIVEKIVKENN